MKHAALNFFLSKKTQALACALGVISLALALLCFILPLSRQRRAIEVLGSNTLNQSQALTLSLAYYEPKRISYLAKNPSIGPSYENIAGLLEAARESFGYQRVYLLYQGVGGSVNYLVDSEPASAQEGSSYQIGCPYFTENHFYDSSCEDILLPIFEGKHDGAYIPRIYNKATVISYLPLLDPQTNTVMAVMGVDAKLTHTDFSSFGSFNLTSASQFFSFVAIVCALILFIGRSLAFNMGDNNKNVKNAKTPKVEYTRRFQKPNIAVPKESTITVDPLDDIDPSDYQ
jgi:hypothetical protein